MFKEYLSFNPKIFPMYLFLVLTLIIAIVLGHYEGSYIVAVLFVILQIVILALIPNIVYLIKHRKESGNIMGFFWMSLVIPIPFVVIAVVMGMVYL